MDRDVPAAIVESATTNAQRKFLGTVGTLPELARENSVKSPAVIIIGDVCRLSDRYDWFGQKPYLGKRVVVARAKPGESKLSEKLREIGFIVETGPVVRIAPLAPPDSLLEKISDYSWLVFTSGAGVNVFFEYLKEAGFDIRDLSHLKIACVGSETEKEVGKRGVNTSYCPAEYNGAALARGLTERVESGERLLLARAKDGAEELTRILTEAGLDFDDVSVYETIREPWKIDIGDHDCAAFTSSRSVESFAEAAGDSDLSGIKAVCIGERTATTARAYGMEVFISAEASIESMVDKVKEVFDDSQD